MILRRTLAPLALAGTAVLALAQPVPAQAATAAAPAAVTAAIPWTGVTDGWTVAMINSPKAWANPSATGTLTLISPTGAQYKLKTLSSQWSVSDVAPGATRIALTRQVSESTRQVMVLNPRTGVSTSFQGPYDQVKFTKPTGLNLLTSRFTQGHEITERRDLQGRLQAVMQGSAELDVLQTQDGAHVLGTTVAGRVSVSGNATGVVVKTFPNPAGATHCAPIHWYDATRFVETCMVSSGSKVQTYLVTFSNGATTVATRAPMIGATQFGYLNAWPTSRGTMVSIVPPCGNAPLALSSGTSVAVLPVDSETHAALDVVNNTIMYSVSQGCGGGEAASLVGRSVLTGKASVLAGGTKNPGRSVDSPVVIDKRY